jgi:hypothetical protein
VFQTIAGKKLSKKIIEAITDRVNEYYPELAPWQNLAFERDPKGTYIHRNYLQIMKINFHQPLHFDGGPLWYADENGHLWSPLSTITNMNDGVGTYLCNNPVQGIFQKVLEIEDDNAAGIHVLKYLKTCEKKFPPFESDNKAGQILAFHPGEQVHCGMGYDGRVDPLVKGLLMRIMLFLCFIPQKFFKRVWNLNMFQSEYAWGLMKKGVTFQGLTDQVFFFTRKFLELFFYVFYHFL